MTESLEYLEQSIRATLDFYSLPYLRSVYAWFSGKTVVIHYIVPQDITEEHTEELSCVSTEVIANFYDNTLIEKFDSNPPQLSDDIVEILLKKR